VALADIITRIDADAEAEGQALLADARTRAEELLAAGEADAREVLARAEERASREARVEAETVLANARLTARDLALSARLALVDEALARTADAIVALPDAEYVAFFARRIAAEARGGEAVQVAPADRSRLAGLEAAVAQAAPGLSLTYPADPAPVEHGIVLVGTRVRVDVSVSAIVAEEHDALAIVVARELFGEEGA